MTRTKKTLLFAVCIGLLIAGGFQLLLSGCGKNAGNEIYNYTFSFSGGTGRTNIECVKLEKTGADIYATIRFSKKNGGKSRYDAVRINGETICGENEFRIPAEINKNFTIEAETLAMSKAHWITYELRITVDEDTGVSERSPEEDRQEKDKENAEGSTEETGEENTEENTEGNAAENTEGSSGAGPVLDETPPVISGLKASEVQREMHSRLLRIFYYEDGITLIEADASAGISRERKKKDMEQVSGGEQDGYSAEDSISGVIGGLYSGAIIKYLTAEEGQELPAGIEKEYIVIRERPKSVYIVSEEALDMMKESDRTGLITCHGFKNENADDLLEEIDFAGTYDDWDLKKMILKKTDLAILPEEFLKQENKAEDGSDPVKRYGMRASQMGMTLWIDRSSSETTDEAKAEWRDACEIIFG